MSFLQGLFGPPKVDKLEAKKDIEGLLKALEYPKDAQVRRAAASALGELGDKRATEPLINAAYEQDRDVRLAAIGALAKIDDDEATQTLVKNIKGLASRTPESKAAAEALLRIGPRAVAALVSVLHNRGGDTNTRVAAITILKTIGGSNVQDALMTTLETEGDFTIYRAAADALHDIGDTQIVDRLITLVEGQDLTKATRAAHVLGNIKDSRAVEPMCALLDKVDRSPGETVAAALANFYDLRVVEALIRAFGKDQTTARPAGEVLVAWSKISVDPLIEALKHPDYKVRQRAVQALWKVKDDRAIEPLKAILDDEDGAVRMTVQNALKSFGVDVAK